MIKTDIKYSFNQFETALIAFMNDIQSKLQSVVGNELPVYIQNTGDFSYFVDKKFLQTNNQELYQKIPRCVVKLDDFQPKTDEDTNQYNKLYYQFDGSVYQATVRRKCFTFNIQTNFVCSNFISMLNYAEVIATLYAKDNVFTYEWCGMTLQASYQNTSGSTEIPSIDMGQGGTRDCVLINSWELQVHLLVPVIDSIVGIDESEIDIIKIDLGVNDDSQTNYEHLQHNKYQKEQTSSVFVRACGGGLSLNK